MGCDWPSEDRTTYLDLIEERPEAADAEAVRRLVATIRRLEALARDWDVTGLAVSEQIRREIRSGMAGL